MLTKSNFTIVKRVMALFARLASGIRGIPAKLSYEIEAVTQMGAAFVAGVDYGIIEAKWIPTGSLGLPLFGRFSPYHVGLLVLMLIVSTSLAWTTRTRWSRNPRWGRAA